MYNAILIYLKMYANILCSSVSLRNIYQFSNSLRFNEFTVTSIQRCIFNFQKIHRGISLLHHLYYIGDVTT